MDDWDDDKLADVVNQKHGAEKTNTTDIICKHFIEECRRRSQFDPQQSYDILVEIFNFELNALSIKHHKIDHMFLNLKPLFDFFNKICFSYNFK